MQLESILISEIKSHGVGRQFMNKNQISHSLPGVKMTYIKKTGIAVLINEADIKTRSIFIM